MAVREQRTGYVLRTGEVPLADDVRLRASAQRSAVYRQLLLGLRPDPAQQLATLRSGEDDDPWSHSVPLITTTNVVLVTTEVVVVAARTAIGVPPQLARRANRVLRPRDASHVYANPRSELARLARTGVTRRLSTGYYALVPQHRLGDLQWRPDLHSAALGIAQADYGVDAVALMGVSAARQHGAIPRAVAVAVVAVPKQRPTLRVDGGDLVFVERDVSKLDVERLDSELTTGWVTTVEQTLVDLGARPALGGLPPDEMREAARALATRTDWEVLERLAKEQRRPAALRRIREWTGRTPDA